MCKGRSYLSISGGMHCVTTADPTHIEEYTRFYCWYAHALLLCARICNCWNFLSSPLVLPVLSYWWTKYQFYEISICQTKPSMEGVFPPKLLLYTQTCVLNGCCANRLINRGVHKFPCSICFSLFKNIRAELVDPGKWKLWPFWWILAKNFCSRIILIICEPPYWWMMSQLKPSAVKVKVLFCVGCLFRGRILSFKLVVLNVQKYTWDILITEWQSLRPTPATPSHLFQVKVNLSFKKIWTEIITHFWDTTSYISQLIYHTLAS